MEEWKEIPGTNGKILVSNEGRIMSLLRDCRILKTCADKKGYLRVRITIERKKMSLKVHREVAKAFIENPKDLPQVNHIDGNKSNNAVSNLEWVSNRENAHHAIANGLWESVFVGAKRENEKRKRPIRAWNEHEEMHFDSISEGQRRLGISRINQVLNGQRETIRGYHFAYERR